MRLFWIAESNFLDKKCHLYRLYPSNACKQASMDLQKTPTFGVLLALSLPNRQALRVR